MLVLTFYKVGLSLFTEKLDLRNNSFPSNFIVGNKHGKYDEIVGKYDEIVGKYDEIVGKYDEIVGWKEC